MSRPALVYYEMNSRPCTQRDIDRLIRHEAVLKTIERKTNQVANAQVQEIHQLILDAYRLDKPSIFDLVV